MLQPIVHLEPSVAGFEQVDLRAREHVDQVLRRAVPATDRRDLTGAVTDQFAVLRMVLSSVCPQPHRQRIGAVTEQAHEPHRLAMGKPVKIEI